MPDLPLQVQALLNPNIYPEKPEEVELIQTQISFVFIAGDYVYKVKKPVNFGFLDFTTLEKRCFYCHQEVLLNKRLCPDIYLDVISITKTNSQFAIEGQGEIVEYAVKMRRLPQDRTMDKLLDENRVTPKMAVSVAQKLVEFHRQVQTIEKGFGDLKTVRLDTEGNLAQMEKYVGITVLPDEYKRIKDYSISFTYRNASLFDSRVKEKRIKDCHGDLHTEHVCFDRDICIFDCIEFNDRFRYIDVANEIAFLAMDLDFHGRPDLCKHFVHAYIGLSGDQELMQLLDFYRCYRAYVCGKVESFKLDDPNISETDKSKALGIAKKYFELADSYALRG